MADRLLLAVALTLTMLSGVAGPAWGQAAPGPSAHALDLDAGPSAGSAPDPLTPAEVDKPAPAAPGAPTTAPEAKPAAEIDPIVTLVRQRLEGAPPPRGTTADRDDHAALVAFYATASQPIWTSKDGFTARATQAVGEIRKADDWGLKASAFDLAAAPEKTATPGELAEAELKLGLAVLKYGRHARGGRVDPPSISRIFDQKPTIYDPKTLIGAVAVSDAVDAYLRDLHPKHPQFERLRQALLAARGVRSENAPPSVKIPEGSPIKPGQEHAHVALVRQRLAAAQAATGKDSLYDQILVDAVKAYQRQRGLEPTGLINAATRTALNGTAQPAAGGNVQRLIVNMERWRWMPVDLSDFYVWDSVPEQMTMVFDKGKQVLAEKIVVGKPGSPTPIFTADMLFVIFHPSWGVPPGMKTHELLPQLKGTGGGWFFSSGPSASSVLKGHDLIVSQNGRPVDPDQVNWGSVDIRSFEFTQPPGPKNLLGIVKFRFPNKHDVYMHDTPERHLFGGGMGARVFSHGCMRVQNPVRLAEVLLAHDKGLDKDKVAEYVRRGGEIKLTTPIPVHITYFTAWVDDDGKLQLRPDVYGMDSRVASALEGQSVHVSSSIVTGSTTVSEPGKKAERAERTKKAQAGKKSGGSQSFDLLGLFGMSSN